MKSSGKLDSRPALAICVVPDEVFENCRPNSIIPLSKRSDAGRSRDERSFLEQTIVDRETGQQGMFDDFEDEAVTAVRETLETFEESRSYSPDFRRQLKGRLMGLDLPVQIIKESTLRIHAEGASRRKRRKPAVRPAVEFRHGYLLQVRREAMENALGSRRRLLRWLGLQTRRKQAYGMLRRSRCLLDSGDGVVFVGEFS